MNRYALQAWKNLPLDGRALYEERARQEVQKYLEEERLYERLLVQYNQLLQSARNNPGILIRALENGLPLVESPLRELIQRCHPTPQLSAALAPTSAGHQPSPHASPWAAGQYQGGGGTVFNYQNTGSGAHTNGVRWSGQAHQPAYPAYPAAPQSLHVAQQQNVQTGFRQAAAPSQSTTISSRWVIEQTHPHHDRSNLKNQSNADLSRLPPKIRVSCRGLRGTMLPKEALILCICPSCAPLPDSKRTFSCREFCAHAGGPASGQGWQNFIKIPPGGAPDVSTTVTTGILLVQWLERHGIDSNDYNFNKTIAEAYRTKDMSRKYLDRSTSVPRTNDQTNQGSKAHVAAPPVQTQPQTASAPYTPWRDGLEGNFNPINVRWAGDRCSICNMDTDYDSDQLIMCDMCGTTVHQSCYGVTDLPKMDEEWLCRSCEAIREGEAPPQCCLCPVIGGALKPTIISGVWCHVVCVQWIPEVTVDDMELMEPVRGIRSIPRDRWELVCCFCKQRMGAKIQCNSCYTAYHPLCGRIAGLHMEMVEEGDGKLSSRKEKVTDEETIHAISYCTRHGPASVQYGIRKVDDRDECGLMEMPERWEPEGDCSSLKSPSPGKLFNGQPYPLPDPAPLPRCPARCARAAPLDVNQGWVRCMHGTGSGATTEVGFWIPSSLTMKVEKDHKDIEEGGGRKDDGIIPLHPPNFNANDHNSLARLKQELSTKYIEISREKRRRLATRTEGGHSDGTGKDEEEDMNSGSVSRYPVGKQSSLVPGTRHPPMVKSLNVIHMNTSHKQAHWFDYSLSTRGVDSYKGDVKKDREKDLVGRWARLWWPEDQEWYVGTVKEYSLLRGQHRVWYEIDGESEWVDLTAEELKGHVQYLPGEGRASWPRPPPAPVMRTNEGPESKTQRQSRNSDIPHHVDVVCNELRGTLYLQRSVIKLKETGAEVSPTEFERLAGRGSAKKWKVSVRIDSPEGQGMTVEAWLTSLGLEDTGFRYTSRSAARPAGLQVATQARPSRQRRRVHTTCSDFRSTGLQSVPGKYIKTADRVGLHGTQTGIKGGDEYQENVLERWGKRAYLEAIPHIVSVGATHSMQASCPPSRCWKPSDWAVHRLWQRHMTETASGSSGAKGATGTKGGHQHLLTNGLAHFPRSASSLVAAIAPLLPSYCAADGVLTVVEDNYSARVSLGYGVDGGGLTNLGNTGRTFTLKDKLKFCVSTEFEKVAFGKSGIHGWGLFARIPIRQDTMVIEFRGQVVRRSVADAREKTYLAQGTDCFMFNLDEDVVIDATRCGTIARFTNHSCNPCLYTKIIACDGESRLAFFARTDIAPGQELTYDYRFHKVEDDEEKIPCRCGAKNCMRYLN